MTTTGAQPARTPPASLYTALAFYDRGWSPVFIPLGGKGPRQPKWQAQRPTRDQVQREFARPGNVGIRLGAPSGNLIDVDLDCQAAIALAPLFLPPTEAIFGRASKPRSHWLITVEPPPKPAQFHDVNVAQSKPGPMLVELRSSGQQSVFPGSVHSSGEVIRWDREGSPARCAPAMLCASVGRLAAAVLLVEHYPAQGSRHEFALAVSGLLLRGGLTAEEAGDFVRAVAMQAGDNEVQDRVTAVRTTAEKLAKAEPTTGATELGKLIGKPVVEKLRGWLWLRPSAREGGAPAYQETPEGIIWHKVTRDGVVPVRLTNFCARIVGDLCHRNGVEERRALEIKAELEGRRHQFTISASSFATMKWPPEQLGPRAVVFPGLGVADHARAAIQLLSPQVVPHTIFEHSGWAQVGSKSVYLHGGGGIGDEGAVSGVEVELPNTLACFVLPSPLQGPELKTAVDASLRLLDIAPRRITVPVLGAVYRAVLGGCDFSVHLSGPTGVFKTSLAALAQSHFGAGFSDRNLPGNWSSTANSLEAIAFAAKDALIVFDDFSPITSGREKLQQQHLAERIFRAQGNRAGRLRMNADTSLRSAKPPRGVILSTGEDSPAGSSLRARMWLSEISFGDVDVVRLTAAQREAAAGQLACAMSGYVRWLAQRIDMVQTELADRVMKSRIKVFRPGQHRRTASIVANLYAGWSFFLNFCEEANVCSDASALRDQIWQGLGEAADAQQHLQAETDPVRLFFELLASAIASGRAHLAGIDGEAPIEARACGWRKDDRAGWRGMGDRVGWVSNADVFLDPPASFRAAQEVGRGGDELTISPHTLCRRLEQAGMLVSRESDRGTFTARKVIEGVRRQVLHLRAAQLGMCAKPAQTAHGHGVDEPLGAG